MFSALTIKEISCMVLLFLTIYLILYLDSKINIKCDCEKNKSNKVSIKVPLIVTILMFVIYKIMEPQIITYFMPNTQIKQSIITDMVDF